LSAFARTPEAHASFALRRAWASPNVRDVDASSTAAEASPRQIFSSGLLFFFR